MGAKVPRGRTTLASLHPLFWCAFAMCAVLLGAADAYGQQQPPAEAPRLIDYTVIKGETCDSIVGKLYGDPTRIDLLHQYNPQLGPTPHTLVAGQKLRLPPPTAGPDARLSFVRNEVDAFTPDRHRGRPGEALMRGHRVATLAASSAVITFRDQTRLQLGANTLVVVLGDTSEKASRSATSADTTLVNGSLRAHLGALAGDKPVDLATPSANVAIGSGEAQVQVDSQRATRVAVYRGQSSLKAGGREVRVPEGYGSRAEKGKAPSKPRRLPPAPVWRAPPKVTGAKGLTVDVSGTYGPGKGWAPIVGWHVQLARDAQFDDLLLDSRVPRKVTRFDALELAPGEYFVRVSAVDAESFESPPSEVVHFAVSPVRVESVGPMLSMVKVPKGLFCAVGDAPLTAVKGPFEVHTSRPRRLRCSPKNDGTAIVETTIPPSSLGHVKLVAKLIQGDKPRKGRIEVTVRDAGDKPMIDVEVTASAPEGVTVGEFKPATQPGAYWADVLWNAGQRSLPLRFAVAGAEPIEPVALQVKELSPPPVADKKTPSPSKLALEVGALGGIGIGGFGVIGPAVSAEVVVRYPMAPVVLAVALRPGYEHYTEATVCGPTPGECRIDSHLFPLSIPLSLRLRPPESFWSPYVSVAPSLFVEVASRTGSTDSLHGTHVRLGVGGFAGFEMRYSRFGAYLELGGRYVSIAGYPSIHMPWFVGSLGLRATL